MRSPDNVTIFTSPHDPASPHRRREKNSNFHHPVAYTTHQRGPQSGPVKQKPQIQTNEPERERMVLMSRTNLSLIAVLAILLAGTGVHAEDWKVGEKWTYKHEGPRPFSESSTKVEGDRTTEVTAIKGEGDAKRYLLKNRWGTSDVNPSTSYIDAKNLIHKIDVQDIATLLLKPPVPAIWELKVGEEKTLKSQMDVGGFVMAIEYKAKRFKDETLTVPAGTYENCQHIQVISTMNNPMGDPVKTKTDFWYHPKVRNLVKDVTVTNFGAANSYTGTSLLKSHTTKK